MVPLTKQLADVITAVRALLVPVFIWLGFNEGSDALPVVVIMMLFNWTGDSIDGVLARMKPFPYQTWIGQRDLEIDMLVSAGLMGYLVASGLLHWQVAALYTSLWAVYFLWKGITRSLGMLFQAPIYGWFIYLSLREEPRFGFLIILWLVVAIIVTWPKFPKEIVPGFLNGLFKVIQRHPDNSD